MQTKNRLSGTFFLWLFVALLAFAGLGRSLWTPDEPREAEIAREMYVAPSFIPHLNGSPFYEKPPLYYSVVAAAFALTGGPSVAAARAVSGLSGLLTLLVVYVWGKRAVSRRPALIAVLMLATCIRFLYATHWVLLDPLLMLFSTLALWAGWELVERSGSARYLALFYGGLALALWTKGLVGAVVPLAGIALYFWVERRRRPWQHFRPLLGLAFLGLVLVSVGGGIWLSGGRQAFSDWLWLNQVQRFVEPQGTGHIRPFYYYLKAVPVAVLPWLVPFLDLFRRAFWQSTRPCAKLRRYAAALTLGGLLVLSMAATKRENYLLPLMPPLMLLLALAVEDRLTGWLQATPRGRWYRIGDWTQATLLVLFALLPAAATVTYLHNVTVAAMAALVVGVAAAAAILCATRRRREDLMLWGAGGAAACFALSALLVAMPPLEPRKDFSPFLETMAAELPVGSSVSVVGADETIEAIVPFITGRSVSLLRAEDLRRPATTFSDEYLPAYLLVQVKRREPDPTPDVEDRYQRLRQVELGRGRTLSFWRRMR